MSGSYTDNLSAKEKRVRLNLRKLMLLPEGGTINVSNYDREKGTGVSTAPSVRGAAPEGYQYIVSDNEDAWWGFTSDIDELVDRHGSNLLTDRDFHKDNGEIIDTYRRVFYEVPNKDEEGESFLSYRLTEWIGDFRDALAEKQAKLKKPEKAKLVIPSIRPQGVYRTVEVAEPVVKTPKPRAKTPKVVAPKKPGPKPKPKVAKKTAAAKKTGKKVAAAKKTAAPAKVAAKPVPKPLVRIPVPRPAVAAAKPGVRVPIPIPRAPGSRAPLPPRQ